MNSERIEILMRLGRFNGINTKAWELHTIVWMAQLDRDEADEVFATEIGALVWAD